MATRIVSLLALAATIAPCLLYFAGMFDHDAVKAVTLVGTAAWFLATPLWMGRALPIDSNEVEI